MIAPVLTIRSSAMPVWIAPARYGRSKKSPSQSSAVSTVPAPPRIVPALARSSVQEMTESATDWLPVASITPPAMLVTSARPPSPATSASAMAG